MTGRTIGGVVYTLTHDAENRLTAMAGGVTASYTYDADGMRVKETAGGATTVYIGNYFEWTGSTATMKSYYDAGAVRVAMRTGTSTGTVNYLLGDHLSSQALTLTSAGARLNTNTELRYYPWGAPRYTVGATPTSYNFTGQRRDSGSGLLYYGARWYDPAVGRFISADTLVPNPGNPQGLNRYAYALDNPLRFSDPTGRFSEDEIMKYLGVKTWDDVLAMFGEEGRFAGMWGWLETLRQAELGDQIMFWQNGSGPFNAHQPDILGTFYEQDGQLMFTGAILNWAMGSGVGVTLPAMTAAGFVSSSGRYQIYGQAPTEVGVKHTHTVWHPDRVDWVDVGLGIVSASSDVGFGAAISGSLTGNVPLALAGATIWGLGTAAGPVSILKGYADWQSGKSTFFDLTVDVGTAVGGQVPGPWGTTFDLAGISYDLSKGIYVGP